MATLLIRNAHRIETFDDTESTFDGGNCIVIPGLVNTHHHFYQTLTRNVPGTQNAKLFDWLTTLYPIWARMDAEAFRSATGVALAELLKSGCTTAFDHTYMWPNGARVDDQIEVAREMGVRFHASRGSMSVGRSKGGLPPDSCVENEDAILADCERVVDAYHDGARYAMTRLVLAPCSPFSVSPDLMRQTAELARRKGVHLHTHLAETFDEEAFCLETFGRRPVELAEDLGWVGPDVWHAHMVHPSSDEIGRLGKTRTGMAHCPTSNMRLASGVAPIGALQKAGVRVGLAVDGSASNDSSHLLMEARQAMLLQRVHTLDPAALTARQALRIATRGGAEVLGRDDIGHLAPGMAADIVALPVSPLQDIHAVLTVPFADIVGFRLDTLDLAGGAVHDPLAALVFCNPPDADFAIINGIPKIEHANFSDLDLEKLITNQNRIARKLLF